jgi:hypothetical protein
MINYIEKENSICKKYQNIIEKEIMSNNFCWYYSDYTSSYKFPAFVHTLLKRPKDNLEQKINSNYYYMFLDILNSFCEINNLHYTKVYRAAINLSYYYNDLEKYQDPHTDHDFPHKVFLIYLNNFNDGHTYLFEKNNNKFDEKTIITSKKNKIVCFDGNIYHTAGFCKPGERRVVCVMTTD